MLYTKAIQNQPDFSQPGWLKKRQTKLRPGGLEKTRLDEMTTSLQCTKPVWVELSMNNFSTCLVGKNHADLPKTKNTPA